MALVFHCGKPRPSKNGYPTREGQAHVVIGLVVYKVTAYLTEGKDPYWVKIVAHKQPDNSANIKKAQAAPRGEKLVF